MKAAAFTPIGARLGLVTVFFLAAAGIASAQDQSGGYDCDNQGLIDACVWGCSAADGV